MLLGTTIQIYRRVNLAFSSWNNISFLTRLLIPSLNHLNSFFSQYQSAQKRTSLKPPAFKPLQLSKVSIEKMSFDDTEEKVPRIVQMALLKKIEKLDMKRDDVVLRDVLNTSYELYGNPNSEERLNIQYWWKNKKRMTIRAYANLLTRLRVPHSNTTKSLLEAERLVPSPVSSTASIGINGNNMDSNNTEPNPGNTTTTATPMASSNQETTDEPKGEDEGLVQAFVNKLNLGGGKQSIAKIPATPPTSHAPYERSTFVTPPKLIPSNHSTFVLPPQATDATIVHPNNMTSSSNSSGINSWNSTPPPRSVPSSASASTCGEEDIMWTGTRTNPVEIIANLKYPERNYPFDINFIPLLEHNGWAREAVEIRNLVGVGDAHCWEAWMDASYHGDGTAVVIKGRSRSSSYDLAHDSYHRNDYGSSQTAAVHKNTIEAIKRDVVRQEYYWRIIFKSVPLDNTIVSGDAVLVKKNDIGTSHLVGSVDCKSCFVSWMIAKKDSGYRISHGHKIAVEDLFV